MFGKLWQAGAVVVGLLWLFSTIQKALFSSMAKIPGPWYSRLTSLWLKKQEFSGSRRGYVHHLHQKYGAAVRLGPNEVSFTSSEALKEIYSSGGSGYDKTEFYTLFKQFDTRTMFSTLWKGDHSQKKRHIANQYANTNILRPQVIKGIQELADAFVNKCVESQEKSMDAYVYLHCYALDCASHHLFNPYGLHSINKPEDRKIMEELSYHDSLKDHLLQYYLPTLTTLLSKIVKPRHSPLSNNYVINTCEKPDPGEHTLLYALQNSKDQFNPIQIAAECSDHFVAGIDTTGDALCFLMYQLSLPESSPIQEKLFHELNENKDKNWDELQYLDAIVKEGLRCFPPIPMSQPRYVPPGGRTINRYFLPAGTIVSCQAWSVHRLNEDVYVDGDTFSLERWLDSTRILEMNRLFFSFGAGGRGCTGRHLAIAEMKCLLRKVYSRFRTKISSDMKGQMDLSDQIISSRPLDQTCKLIFERREST